MKTRNVLLFCITLIIVALILAPTNSRFPKVSSLVSFVKNWGPVIIPFIKDEQPQPTPAEDSERFQSDMPDTLVNGEPPRIPDMYGQLHVNHAEGW